MSRYEIACGMLQSASDSHNLHRQNYLRLLFRCPNGRHDAYSLGTELGWIGGEASNRRASDWHASCLNGEDIQAE